MKTTVIYTLFSIFSITCIYAQYATFFYDTKNFRAVQENHLMRMAMEAQFTLITESTKESMNDANLNMLKVVATKQMVHDALLNVNSAFRNCKQIKYIGDQVGDISSNVNLLRKEVSDAPQFSIFVSQYVSNAYKNALAISEMVTKIALKGSENNIMMNYQQRDRLLSDISERLHIINANLALMTLQIKQAKLDGFWKSVNPFRSWINQDRRMIETIIIQSKYL